MKHGLVLAGALSLSLAACGSDDQPVDGQAVAGGEVLEASVSDAMLPLDRVRSEAPLAGADADQSDSNKPAVKPDAD